LHYRKKLNEKVSLGLGATYSTKAAIDTDRQVAQERRTLDDLLISSITTDSVEGHTTLPQVIQLGLSIDNNKTWSAGIDFTNTKGSDFRGFSLNKDEGR